jgi:hypothetical protein
MEVIAEYSSPYFKMKQERERERERERESNRTNNLL